VRINDEKRKNIVKGDRLLFYKLPDMKESISANVEQIYNFCGFKEVYESFPMSYFGYDGIHPEDMLDKIYGIYTKEEENLGVVAIKFNVEKQVLLIK
ncbi:MAG TPA: hypothetical protein VFC70_00795, partial [Oscillospiraceae bacterium]|nr:hypothetical protein [Oscillospiraceae bacterium]